MFPSGIWLTSRRVRAHGLIIGVVLWSVYLWTLATPGLRDRFGNVKGTDFLHFYTLGVLAQEHRGMSLYDMSAQSALTAERIPELRGVRYLPLYPPQVSILFLPFAHLPYAWALISWWIICFLIYGLSCFAVWRSCPNLRSYGATVVILAAAFPPFFHLIAWGQTSALALAALTAMYLALRARHNFLAGLAVGCLIFKPQLLLAAAIIVMGAGAWKILTGAALSAITQLSTGVLYFGMQPLLSWQRTLMSVFSVLPWLEPRPYQTHCLRTFWSMMIPWQRSALILYFVSAALVLVMTIALWRRGDRVSLSLRFPALLLSTILVSPHLTVYDLVILAPAILLLADWLVTRAPDALTKALASLLYLIYVTPLIGVLAQWTHVQVSVLAMALASYFLWRRSSSAMQGIIEPNLETGVQRVN